MNQGDIILIPFPFAEMTRTKVRPAVVIAETDDKYHDLVISAISSVIPEILSARDIELKPDHINNLRASSVIKTDRIVTLRRELKIADLGRLSPGQLNQFRAILIEIIG